MKEETLKLKKGGMDTIIAYIVVMLPLLYVLIYMVATIYHFSVQMYLNQVVKEATVMASTFGEITPEHIGYITGKLDDSIFRPDENNNKCEIKCYVKRFSDGTGLVSSEPVSYSPGDKSLKKGDIIGIAVKSTTPSMLGNVTSFNIFGPNSESSKLYYSSYREEIIRNERKFEEN